MVSSLNGCDISSFFSYPSHQISLSLKSVNQTNFPYPHPQNVFLCNLLAHIQDNNKRKHGYFRVAYTCIQRDRQKRYVINPGYFRVAYTLEDADENLYVVIDPGYFRVAYTKPENGEDLEAVIDPGYFRVAYTWVSKTSLYNKV